MKRLLWICLLVPLSLCLSAQSQSEWADRAYAYMAQDSLPQAEECFRRAVEAAPTSRQNVMLLANLGTVQRRRGKIHEAKIEELWPTHVME